MKKAMNITSNILIAILIIVTVALAVLRMSGANFSSTFKYNLFVISSGSMEPTYKINDVILCEKVDTSDLEIGDVITYQSTIDVNNDGVDDNITHRIVDIYDENGATMIVTKGDANDNEDTEFIASKVIGKVVYKFYVLSFVYKILSTILGFVLIIVLPLLYLIIREVIALAVATEKNKEVDEMSMEIPQKAKKEAGETDEKE